jgi:non-specific serine/threonine protein kinase
MSPLGLLPKERTIAGYTIREVLGRGATAVVYRATRPGRDEPVALKLIAPDAYQGDGGKERYEREARLAAAVVHRGILPVYEVGEYEGRSFVAMKLAPGDLAGLLREEHRLKPARAVALASQLASALDAAHAHGLVHRDVKPSNVLLDEDEDEERAYLADFGVARATFSDRNLRTGELVGTVGYASPEQIRGEPVDHHTDVYALGCLLYECLTGRVPYASRDALATLWGHLHNEPPQPSVLVAELPRGLNEVVRCALAKTPEARFGSAGELAEAACGALARRSPSPQAAAPERLANTHLTIPASSFLGREEELREARLKLEKTRLLTVTGPGGAGKTRFAIELASRAGKGRSSKYPGGVFACFLAALRDPALVLPTIAQTLSVSELQGKSALDALAAKLAGERVLLVLDNAEHLPSAVEELAQLIAACPSLTLLVTSRERLRVAEELAYELPPLGPEEGVALFCERAVCNSSEPIRELCVRMEGLPLAIELAAANMPLLPPEELLARLTERLDLRRAGRDADPRQQTLRATIEWSYDLLALEAQTLFARLSVFVGGCTPQAAEAVCDAEFGALEALVDKSLLLRSGDRYWMLETIREFAAERLEESGDAGERRRRHAEHFAELVERLDPRLRTSRHLDTVDRLETEKPNFVRAIEWAIEADPELALDLFGRLKHVWWDRGREGWILAPRVLAAAQERPTIARASALHAASGLAWTYGELEQAVSLEEHAVAIYEELGNTHGSGTALVFLGLLYKAIDRDDGRETLEQGLVRLQAAGDEYGTANAMGNLSDFALQDGDFAAATRWGEQSAARAREHGFELIEAMATCNQTVALVHQADPCALETARSALRLCARTNMHLWIGNTLFLVAAAMAADEPRRAAVLLGAAEAELQGARLAPAERAVYEQAMTTARQAVGVPAFEQSFEEGRMLCRDAALELGLGSGDSPA